MKKVFLLILLIFFKITPAGAKEKIFILTVINNEPITNIDVVNETPPPSQLPIEEASQAHIDSLQQVPGGASKSPKNFIDIIKNFYK